MANYICIQKMDRAYMCALKRNIQCLKYCSHYLKVRELTPYQKNNNPHVTLLCTEK